MDGVTILKEYVSEPSVKSLVVGIVVIVVLVVIAICFFCSQYNKAPGANALIGIMSAIITAVGIGGIIVMSLAYVNAKTVTYYEVTIDDSVSFNEFKEKYRIISDKDGVYTVELIEQEEQSG